MSQSINWHKKKNQLHIFQKELFSRTGKWLDWDNKWFTQTEAAVRGALAKFSIKAENILSGFDKSQNTQTANLLRTN